MKPKLIAIGYWYSIYEPELPNPACFEDSNWNLKEKNLVIEHLKKGKSIADWMGTSWCRYRCGESGMGASCLTDGKYIFPEKLTHYIEQHNLRLPREFVNHVTNYKSCRIFSDISKYEIDYDWWKRETGFNKKFKKRTFLAETDKEIEKFKNRL